MSLRARHAFAFPLLLASVLAGGVSRADEKAECLAAASKGQTLRDAHALIEARAQFQICARRECPPLVQTDCGAWLEAVERTLPSIVLSAQDATGRDLFDVTVTADGNPLATKLDGQSVPMNPGAHSFRFELPGGTSGTVSVLVKEGEQAQRVAVVLQPEPAAVATQAPPAEAPPTAATTEPVKPLARDHRGAAQRAIGLVLGGLGVVGVGIGAGIAIDAKSKDNAARNEGGTGGDTSSKNAVSQGNVGTVVFVTGAVVAAAGIVVWLTAPRAKMAVGTDGSELLLRGSF
jgi:hypothetical protein